jgi:tRNA(Arg) A34 adenosine deaminase TadA
MEAMTNPFMSKAIELAVENVRCGRGGPFAAVVAKQGALIAQGTNLVTSTNDPTAHAEIVAIREACKSLGHFQLSGCEMYTTCEPCPMCFGAIYWARPAKVFFASTRQDAAAYGFDDCFILQQLQLAVSERRIPMIQLMREEALQAFHAWDEKTDRIQY